MGTETRLSLRKSMTTAEKQPFFEDAAKQKTFKEAMPACSFYMNLGQPPVQERRAEALGVENDVTMDNGPEASRLASVYVCFLLHSWWGRPGP